MFIIIILYVHKQSIHYSMRQCQQFQKFRFFLKINMKHMIHTKHQYCLIFKLQVKICTMYLESKIFARFSLKFFLCFFFYFWDAQYLLCSISALASFDIFCIYIPIFLSFINYISRFKQIYFSID